MAGITCTGPILSASRLAGAARPYRHGTMTVDEYLDAAPEPQATTLRSLRATLRSILPDASEAMAYGVPAIRLDGKAIAGYAHAKRHCSYFPHSGDVLHRVDPALLGDLDWSKGTLRFPVDTPPDEVLVQRLVDLRLAELAQD